PPTVKCETKLWHPNITEDGDICLSLLRQNSIDGLGWAPTRRLKDVIWGLNSLFTRTYMRTFAHLMMKSPDGLTCDTGFNGLLNIANGTSASWCHQAVPSLLKSTIGMILSLSSEIFSSPRITRLALGPLFSHGSSGLRNRIRIPNKTSLKLPNT
ncbi:unnamed protein product, partial [Nesidiocoris tenuis]